MHVLDAYRGDPNVHMLTLFRRDDATLGIHVTLHRGKEDFHLWYVQHELLEEWALGEKIRIACMYSDGPSPSTVVGWTDLESEPLCWRYSPEHAYAVVHLVCLLGPALHSTLPLP